MKLKLLCFYIVFASSFTTFAQNTFVSKADQDLSIKTVVPVPCTDNVDGIYAKPLTEEIKNIVNDDKQWSLVEFPSDKNLKTDLLDESPNDVKAIQAASKADAVLSCKIVRGTKGLSMNMTLFAGAEGLPLIQDSFSDYKGFDIADVKSEAKKLFESIKYKMPYRAVIISRRGQQVTINLGSTYGLKPDSYVSVIQIIKVNRHPKLKFMVSTDKEVLGKIKLAKVEPYLSFGYIELERDPGVITVGSKIMPSEFVKYSVPAMTASGKVIEDITNRPDSDLAFGKDPKEWKPEPPPQFGKVELMAGFGNYTQSVKLNSEGSFNGSSNFAPGLLVSGELWINPEWYLGIGIRQSIFSIDNGLVGSTPSKLNMAMGSYYVTGGYNFLLTDNFFGPKIQVAAGYMNTNFTVDGSTPTAFTTSHYGSFLLSIAGQFPLSEEIPMDFGAKFDFSVNPTLNEDISSGASSSNNIYSFSVFGDYRLKQRFRIKGELIFDYYNSSFSGTGQRTDPASSTSHRMSTLYGGIEYLF
jgi:hypothetical protein